MRPYNGNERICVIIVVIDNDQEIVIVAVVILCDPIVVVHGHCYVVNSDIRLRSRNFYL